MRIYSRGRIPFRGRGRGGNSYFGRQDRGGSHMIQHQMHPHGPPPDPYYNHPSANQPPAGMPIPMSTGYHDPSYDMQSNRYAKFCLYKIVLLAIYQIIWNEHNKRKLYALFSNKTSEEIVNNECIWQYVICI